MLPRIVATLALTFRVPLTVYIRPLLLLFVAADTAVVIAYVSALACPEVLGTSCCCCNSAGVTLGTGTAGGRTRDNSTELGGALGPFG